MNDKPHPLWSDKWTGPKPAGCVCAGDWFAKPNTICDRFEADSYFPTLCGNCEHDQPCHNPQETSND